jgi:hypothetical protein
VPETLDPEARWVCSDPGETAGWSLWKGAQLLGGGQTPLWQFAHDFHSALADNVGPLAEGETDLLRPGWDASHNTGPIKLLVCEKFALYPWAAKELAFDEFRTVQLIGAMTFTCALFDVKLHKQPASIKERAMAGGAKELFVRPLHENRHQNDSIMHGFFYHQVEVKGVNLQIPDGTKKGKK